MKKICAFCLVLIVSGCSSAIQDVKPWEKENFSKESMKADGGNKLFYNFQKHIYFSKEATKGGGGVAGGGCGCN